MADIFDEIDEELKQDRAKQVWLRYGKYVVAAAVAIVPALAPHRDFPPGKIPGRSSCQCLSPGACR